MVFKIMIVLSGLLLLKVHGQERDLKIVKVLEANLFQTEDSLLVKMADLRAPSKDSGDSLQAAMALKAIEFAKIHLLNLTSRFIPSPGQKCSDEGIISGHLFRKYPLADTHINVKYLELGYAVYLPCDTLFMDAYRTASEKAMDKKNGFWAKSHITKKLDLFNRGRVTSWSFERQFTSEKFLPIIGFNYRWSDLYSILDLGAVQFNLSAETGTFFILVFPYGNLGAELRLGSFYLRAHYDVVVPFPFLQLGDTGRLEVFNFYGLDLGVMVPLPNRRGFELELNYKDINENLRLFFSISFALY